MIKMRRETNKERKEGKNVDKRMIRRDGKLKKENYKNKKDRNRGKMKPYERKCE